MKRLRFLLTALLFAVPAFLAVEPTFAENLAPVATEEVFTPDALRAYLVSTHVKHPQVAFAQAVLETGNFSSQLFRDNHNLFGMKYVDTCHLRQARAHYRPTVATKEQFGHAYYATWQQSVDDYLLWQRMFKRTNLDEEGAYVAVLATTYCPDRAGKFNHAYAAAVNYLKTKTTCPGVTLPASSGS